VFCPLIPALHWMAEPECHESGVDDYFFAIELFPEWRLDARNCVAGVRWLWDWFCSLVMIYKSVEPYPISELISN
jgi:hypothetical protein